MSASKQIGHSETEEAVTGGRRVDTSSPIIIIGSGRSGTSLLQAVLGSHPDIRMLGEFQYATFDLWRSSWRVAAAVGERSRRVLCARSARTDDRDDVDDDLVIGIAAECVNAERQRIGGILRRSLGEIYGIEADRGGGWGFKEIWLRSDAGHTWEPFDAIFPNANYVHLVRSPFSFAISCAAWNRNALTLDSLRQLLAGWVACLHHNRQRVSTGRYHFLRYEDLIARPEVVIANLMSWLDLPMTSESLAEMNTTFLPSQASKLLPRGARMLMHEVDGLADAMSELGYAFPDYPEAESEDMPSQAAAIEVAPQRWRLLTPFQHDQGYSWLVPLQHVPGLASLEKVADDLGELKRRSPVQLFEDGKALGPAHCRHLRIRQYGMGGFSHWYIGHVLMFSTSDNSDPNCNGRQYEIAWG